MAHPLMIRPEAEHDLLAGRDWYDGQRPGLGTEFLTAVDVVFDRIRQSPELCAAEYRGIRRTAM